MSVAPNKNGLADAGEAMSCAKVGLYAYLTRIATGPPCCGNDDDCDNDARDAATIHMIKVP